MGRAEGAGWRPRHGPSWTPRGSGPGSKPGAHGCSGLPGAGLGTEGRDTSLGTRWVRVAGRLGGRCGGDTHGQGRTSHLGRGRHPEDATQDLPAAAPSGRSVCPSVRPSRASCARPAPPYVMSQCSSPPKATALTLPGPSVRPGVLVRSRI